MSETSERLLTAKQVASRLSVCVEYVYRLAKAGELRCVHLGERKAKRYRPADVDNLINARLSGGRKG